jgi:pimeloyl-ACP methyl ester carboxylesterase
MRPQMTFGQFLSVAKIEVFCKILHAVVFGCIISDLISGLTMKPQIQEPDYDNLKLHRTKTNHNLKLHRRKTMMLSIGLLLIAILALSCISTSIFKQQNQALGQSYIQTIKFRILVIDLGNGLKTNAQLTYPAIGKGPFPGVLLIHGSGHNDKNGTVGFIHKNGPKPPTPLWQIAQYLSERGFAVLRYDKRGAGANNTILDANVWGNATVNDFIHDAEKALNVLIQQPEVDPKRISLIGHSEGTIIAPRVAVDNPTKVKNIVLLGAQAQSLRDSAFFQFEYIPLLYAEKHNHNHNGSISIQEASKDPVFQSLTATQLSPSTVKLLLTGKVVTIAQLRQSIKNASNNSTSKQNYIRIDKDLKPLLIKKIESLTAKNASCTIDGCPAWWRSHFSLGSNLGMIGNISSSTGILILQGENDTQIPVQQAFLLQQRLTDVNHHDHTLITYPNLGHLFYPSSQWSTGIGPIEPYVLADLYAWLEAHSGFTNSNITHTTTASIIGINTSSSSKG